MIEHGRPPLFEDPDNTYESAKKYVELRLHYHRDGAEPRPAYLNYGRVSVHEDVLIRKMGCSWDVYVPETYQTLK